MSPLLSILLERSVKFGDFVLASGAKSEVYVDVRQTALTGDGARAIGVTFFELIQKIAPNAKACGGLTLGADPIVTSVAIAAHDSGRVLDAMIVRKEAKIHGTQRAIESPTRVTPGDEVVVVDDVITTAGSTLKAVEALRDAGFVVNHAICVVDREAGGAQALADAGVELHSILTLRELLKYRG